MVVRVEIGRAWQRYAASGFLIVAILAGASSRSSAQSWPSYSHDAQHTCQASVASMIPQAIRWQTPVDLDPQYSGGNLYTHYGSPLITSSNLVLVPVKTAAHGGFRLEARHGSNGSLFWAIISDYAFPRFNWIPPWGPVLAPGDSMVAMPAAGGTLLVRKTPDSGHGNLTRIAFFGIANYQGNPAAFNSAIQICTPITCDGSGNLYFGYVSSGVALPGYPNGIPSGLAVVSSSGSGTFKGAAALSGDARMVKVSYNCAPAVTADGSAVYVAVNNIPVSNTGSFGSGYLCKLKSSDLSMQASVFLNDPRSGVGAANITDDSTSSPTIGPDGDVYYGVLEGNFPSNNDRGWMLHFSSDLSTVKIPGAFGWDNTASIVPASAVPSYSGTSSYLILTKYNNYAGIGSGNGHNKLAVLDPGATETDPITGATVMREVLTILGPTALGSGVREWCINSAAIDSVNKCAVVNSEDGHVYRWDFTTNSLSPAFPMAAATGEAYTPTVVGPDGAVYAINNAELYCCQASAPAVVQPPVRPRSTYRRGSR
ncbi:MAG: hypothetical protein ACHRXM_22735 [Isosphaerales bacterium]